MTACTDVVPGTVREGVSMFLSTRAVTGSSPNTVRTNAAGLARLVDILGDRRLAALTPRDGERFAASLVAELAPNSVNTHLASTKVFFTWARICGYMPVTVDPLGTVRAVKVPERSRLRIPASDFPALLDAAPTPHVRIIVALGLYLFLRASEICALTAGSVDLTDGWVTVWQPKTRRIDRMPMCEELTVELVRWYRYATPPDRSSYLVPARRRALFDGGRKPTRPAEGVYDWTRPVSKTERHIQSALTAAGYDLEPGEGVHTLRRSAARAWFDQLVESGTASDSALLQVAAMLHHRSVVVTQRYLGVDRDVDTRDRTLHNAQMFPQ